MEQTIKHKAFTLRYLYPYKDINFRCLLFSAVLSLLLFMILSKQIRNVNEPCVQKLDYMFIVYEIYDD
ncbi:hypothetical protein DQG23_33510 [Paenibacillus contaminans]|uniref:Uncharacterized protein n=1 Tax=Paenibacillus contaminans TaxID=450362 RepID=A0A329M260_9BACL|nr:hypothetical protein DQG23_33510 [Paenibacillus contaminans]